MVTQMHGGEAEGNTELERGPMRRLAAVECELEEANRKMEELGSTVERLGSTVEELRSMVTQMQAEMQAGGAWHSHGGWSQDSS